MSFDSRTAQYEMELTKSQSLSSRAMSFDKVLRNNSINLSYVSIPFEQGDVFRPAIVSSMLWTISVSIPFEQGDVFRQFVALRLASQHLSQSLSSRAMSFDQKQICLNASLMRCLNPFRAGRCLSTKETAKSLGYSSVSIPFEQGDVFRPNYVEMLELQH